MILKYENTQDIVVVYVSSTGAYRESEALRCKWYAGAKKRQVAGCEMRCPFCKEDRDKVIDSRSSEGGRVIRRRRQCLACKRRFTTYEKIGESFKLYVTKKDGSRVPYDREKIVTGLQKACYKRPVSAEQIQQIVDKVEESVFRNFDKEVSSTFIGESVMKQLRKVDKVAYIRFASVYRDFKDAGELIDEVREAIQRVEPVEQPTLFNEKSEES